MVGIDERVEALHNAASNGDAKEVDRLIGEGVEVNAINDFGKTALHYAVNGGVDAIERDIEVKNRTEVVGALIKAGAKVNAVDVFGSTALHYAAKEDYTGAVDELLAAKADPNIKAESKKFPESGTTALHVAVVRGDAEMVGKLLAAGAKTNIRDRVGRLAIDCCRSHEVQEAFIGDAVERNQKGMKLVDMNTTKVGPPNQTPRCKLPSRGPGRILQ